MAGNTKNLTPFNKMDEAKAREIHIKGGRASGESKRRRKTLKEELLLLVSEENNQEKISVALINMARMGDVQAFKVIRDTIGEKPVEKQEIKKVDTNWFIEDDVEDEET